ncbi:MAG: DJ-1/PfpI family protein [Lentisphaeraceae bacterium]|nr:DJ-1/PfpI family protein [Lentisphaeraceae bacterium]
MKAAILFADGFEEIEAVTPVDVLRRLGVDSVMVGVFGMEVTGSRGISMNMDCLLDDIFVDDFDVVILPGGLPGAHHLRDNDQVQELIQDAHSLGKLVAAICAAPVALDRAGIIENCRITSHPSKESELQCCEEYTQNHVEIDENIITSRGPGTSLDFAYAIAEKLGLKTEVNELKKAMMYK